METEKIQGLEIPMDEHFSETEALIKERDELAIEVRVCMCWVSEINSGNTDTL